MTVGGWYDAEDLFGPLEVYRHTGQMNPGITNMLVMGPWSHGAWGKGPGEIRFVTKQMGVIQIQGGKPVAVWPKAAAEAPLKWPGGQA